MKRIQSHSKKWIQSIRWDANGLVPCIVQDERDHAVLMVAYMNRKSLQATVRSGKCVFWSRSRKKFWLKGEESGHFQIVKRIFVDCDNDCLLIHVKQVGGAACHTGMRSCFYRRVGSSGKLISTGKSVFNPKKVYRRRRRRTLVL